jgi:3-hydroxybutyryl-CoA dehydrogenase
MVLKAWCMQIDKSMTLGANHPMGPLALADLIVNDVVLVIVDMLLMEPATAIIEPYYTAKS